jgi:putative hydrolase of the HAD superfamily
VSDLEPTEVESRRAARDRALELLYEAEVKGLSVDEVLAALPVAPVELAAELARGVAAHRARVDEVIARRVAPKWSLSRLAALDRAVLRLGTYELMERHDRPQAVVINEAVVLARRYGGDQSPKFVNGVLSAVAAEYRGAGAAPQPAGAAAAGAGFPADRVADVAEAEAAAVGPDDAFADLEPADLGGDDLGLDADLAAVAGEGPEAIAALGPADALVIDLDGVIRLWGPNDVPATERDLGLAPGAIASVAFAPDRIERAMTGALGFEDWCAEIGAGVAARHPVDAATVAKAFASTDWSIDPQVLALVDAVRVEASVALLSNASTRLLADLRSSGIDDRFDAVVGSADIGVTKPASAAYEAAAARLGVSASECLMVDDRPENVAGARAAGMQAYLYTGVEGLRAALVATGLLPDGDDDDL